MGSTLVLRSSNARVVGAFAMGVGLLGVAWLVATGEWSTLPTYGAVLAAIALIGWSAFWTPYVEVSDGGVVLRNVLRTVTLPWPAIEEIQGRYGLELTTAYGRFTAWAASAPVGRDRRRGGSSLACEEVLQRRQELAEYLEAPRLERERPVVHWHWPELAAAGALVAVTVIGAIAA